MFEHFQQNIIFNIGYCFIFCPKEDINSGTLQFFFFFTNFHT